MKNLLLRFLAVAAIFSTILFVGGCEKKFDTFVDPQTSIEMTTMDSMKLVTKITDPIIIRQLDYLYKKQAITKEDFCNYHKTGKLNEFADGTKGYVAYGDGLITTEGVNERMKFDETTKNARYRLYPFMYTGGTVSVRIHSNVPAAWQTAIYNACAKWNSLGSNVNLHFNAYLTTSVQDAAGELDIYYNTYLNPAYPAFTNYPPKSGAIGESMYINLYATYPPDDATKPQAILHEIGHAIGMAHTNTTEYNLAYAPLSCNAETVSSSFLFSTLSASAGFPAFSTCDKSIIDYYWGNNLA